ncbi:MAG TPA: protein-export chaperone SecB [Caulobacteraceae bacterium]|jgi:preprotein translocase subunit SecB|nr:protein-export chaperone SecB [Caulobacteraceae bacterium]
MTDQGAAGPTPVAADPNAPPTPGIRIMAQFIRDLSFENPRAPESLRATGGQPQIELGVEMAARTRQDELHEVDLKLTATAQSNNEAIFTVELLYGGLFQIGGVPADALEQVLLIECPRYLFPFARRIIADMTSEGGFPPFMLEPIDFAMVYAARNAQMAQEPAGTA